MRKINSEGSCNLGLKRVAQVSNEARIFLRNKRHTTFPCQPHFTCPEQAVKQLMLGGIT